MVCSGSSKTNNIAASSVTIISTAREKNNCEERSIIRAPTRWHSG